VAARKRGNIRCWQQCVGSGQSRDSLFSPIARSVTRVAGQSAGSSRRRLVDQWLSDQDATNKPTPLCARVLFIVLSCSVRVRRSPTIRIFSPFNRFYISFRHTRKTNEVSVRFVRRPIDAFISRFHRVLCFSRRRRADARDPSRPYRNASGRTTFAEKRRRQTTRSVYAKTVWRPRARRFVDVRFADVRFRFITRFGRTLFIARFFRLQVNHGSY